MVKPARGRQCSAFGCKKRKMAKSAGRSDSEGSSDEESVIKRKFPRTFHCFPSNQERRDQWIKNMRIKNWTPKKDSIICSDHFMESHIYRVGLVVRLKEDAVPTRFKAFPKYLRKVKKERKSPFPRQASQTAVRVVPGTSGIGVVYVPGAVPKDIGLKKLEPKTINGQKETKVDNERNKPTGSEIIPPTGPTSNLSLPQVTATNANLSSTSIKSQNDGSNGDITCSVVNVPTVSDLNELGNKAVANVPVLDPAITDHTYCGHFSVQQLHKQLNKSQARVAFLTKKLKSSQQKTRRLTNKVTSLKEMVNQLKQQNNLAQKPLKRSSVQAAPSVLVEPAVLSKKTLNQAVPSKSKLGQAEVSEIGLGHALVSTKSAVPNQVVFSQPTLNLAALSAVNLGEALLVDSTLSQCVLAESTLDQGVAQSTLNQTDLSEINLGQTMVPELTLTQDVVAESILKRAIVPESTLTQTIVPESALPEGVVAESTLNQGVVAESTVTEGVIAESTLNERAVTGATLDQTVLSQSTLGQPVFSGQACLVFVNGV